MTTYRNESENLTVYFGPGAVHLSGDDGVGWVSADVALKLEYESHAPEGQTRAVLELIAEQVDPNGWGRAGESSSSDEVHVQIELTFGDLIKTRDMIDALIAAVLQDESDDDGTPL